MGSFDSLAFTGTHVPGLTGESRGLSRLAGHHRAARGAQPPPWTRDAVMAAMRALYPAGDAQQPLRHELRSAYLAGMAASHDDMLLRPAMDFAFAAVDTSRTLMKNRAAGHDTRLWHAFCAGRQAARVDLGLHAMARSATAAPTSAKAAAPLNLFVRQPFTESNEAQQHLIAEVLAQIDQHNGQPNPFRYLTGRQAESADTFRRSFEAQSGQAFTPRAFRDHRLKLLDQAEAFINIRVGMSESSAFELSYHIFRGACTPVLFLVWKHAPIKTTLLKDLEDHCDITYLEFERADELSDGIDAFLRRCARHSFARSFAA